MYDVVIVTHRDLVALAPQPLYLARALAAKGLRVVLVCTSPAWLCRELATERFEVVSPATWRLGGRGALLGLFALALPRLLRCRVAVNFDINNLWIVAQASRWRRFARVLYWLEPFYGDYGERHASRTARLGQTALPSVLPPDALVDVNPERLAISGKLCGDPDAAFVLRNVPPLASAWNTGGPSARAHAPRLVYAGSVTGVGYEGVELLIRGLARSESACTLTIHPAEGRPAAGDVAAVIAECGCGDRVTLGERVEREQLPGTLAAYDVGVVLYPVRPGQNINSRLAAPNKLYEYLASGLAVLASNNETLQFVSKEGLGWNLATVDLDAVAALLERLGCRDDVDARRHKAYDSFLRSYNYAAESGPLVDWIASTARGRRV